MLEMEGGTSEAPPSEPAVEPSPGQSDGFQALADLGPLATPGSIRLAVDCEQYCQTGPIYDHALLNTHLCWCCLVFHVALSCTFASAGRTLFEPLSPLGSLTLHTWHSWGLAGAEQRLQRCKKRRIQLHASLRAPPDRLSSSARSDGQPNWM